MKITRILALDNRLQTAKESDMATIVDALENNTYYKTTEGPKAGWTGMVDGSGEKPTIQTSRHECCW